MESSAQLNDSGIALTGANRPYEAIKEFEKALVLDPANPLLWLNLGIAQQRIGEYQSALDSFQRSLNINSDLADAWGAMGLIYYELEHYEKAEEHYQAALLRDNSSSKVWNNLGVLYFNLGNYEDARCCFEEALCYYPHYYDALYNIRDTCRELKDFKAAAEFERMLSGINSRDRDRPLLG